MSPWILEYQTSEFLLFLLSCHQVFIFQTFSLFLKHIHISDIHLLIYSLICAHYKYLFCIDCGPNNVKFRKFSHDYTIVSILIEIICCMLLWRNFLGAKEGLLEKVTFNLVFQIRVKQDKKGLEGEYLGQGDF